MCWILAHLSINEVEFFSEFLSYFIGTYMKYTVILLCIFVHRALKILQIKNAFSDKFQA